MSPCWPAAPSPPAPSARPCARLPPAVFQTVLRELVKALVSATETVGRWRGHRTFLVDGSSFSMPDTPSPRAHFGQPGNQAKGRGFPVAHILALFHAGAGLLVEVFAAPLRSHDMAGIAGILPLLAAGDLCWPTAVSARSPIWPC